MIPCILLSTESEQRAHQVGAGQGGHRGRSEGGRCCRQVDNCFFVLEDRLRLIIKVGHESLMKFI